jgi:threonine synthase
VICASSGNAAASVAAYAARAGVPCVIVVPADVPANKLASLLAYGPTPIAVPGDYSRSFAMARELARTLGLTNLATTYVNPHAVAALRTVAFDLVEQVGPRVDWVHVPTGSGPLVHGVVQGFRDLCATGEAARLPRAVAVQPEGCAPIAAAFDAGVEWVTAWPRVTTAVSGINDPLEGYEGDGALTLRELHASGGRALAVSDADILAAQELLAAELGVFVEPAAASSVAGLLALAEVSAYGPDDTVVCLLTGHGLKTVGAEPARVPVAADLAAAMRVLRPLGLEGRG